MSTRLTNPLRDRIVANALAKAGITAAEEALQVKRFAWAEAVRAKINGAPDDELLKLEAKAAKALTLLPEHLRPDDGEILLRRDYDYVNLAGLSICVKFAEKRIVPRPKCAIPADDPLVQQFHDLDAEEKDLRDRRSTIRAQVRAVLNSVTTVKKLLAVWPEAKELLPENLEEAKVNLPALAVNDLNTMIGLPTEEAA